jgi:hypothetical protein
MLRDMHSLSLSLSLSLSRTLMHTHPVSQTHGPNTMTQTPAPCHPHLHSDTLSYIALAAQAPSCALMVPHTHSLPPRPLYGALPLPLNGSPLTSSPSPSFRGDSCVLMSPHALMQFLSQLCGCGPLTSEPLLPVK